MCSLSERTPNPHVWKVVLSMLSSTMRNWKRRGLFHIELGRLHRFIRADCAFASCVDAQMNLKAVNVKRSLAKAHLSLIFKESFFQSFPGLFFLFM